MLKKVQKTKVKSKKEIISVKKGDKLFIGIDVHKKKYHLAINKNSKLERYWVMPHDNNSIVKMLMPVKKNIIMVVYEAGLTGYALARTLQAAGIAVKVVAPGKTPQVANQGNKSDRLDCRKLADYAENNILSYVAVPTEEQDEIRSLIRRRDTLKRRVAKQKNQIKSFLIYHSLPVLENLKSWSRKGLEELVAAKMPEILKLTIVSMVDELKYLDKQVCLLDKKLQELLEQREGERREILLSHPGVGPQTSNHFLIEIFSPERFSNKKEIVSYVGLAPRISRSGESLSSCGRIHGGRRVLRSCLLEASWTWINKDICARKLYHRYLKNTGNAKKAITAIARKMLINLWSMLMRNEYYRPPQVN